MSLPVIAGLALIREGVRMLSGPSQGASPVHRMIAKTVTSDAERVAWIRQEAKAGEHDGDVILLARQIIAQRCRGGVCRGERDWAGYAADIHNWMRGHIIYTYDPVEFDLYTAVRNTLWGVIDRRMGPARACDCDCACAVNSALCAAVGLPSVAEVVETWDGDHHIYPRIGVPPERVTQWIPSDTTEGFGFGWEVPANMVKQRRTFALIP
jgi:hypothetical protein